MTALEEKLGGEGVCYLENRAALKIQGEGTVVQGPAVGKHPTCLQKTRPACRNG